MLDSIRIGGDRRGEEGRGKERRGVVRKGEEGRGVVRKRGERREQMGSKQKG